MLNFLRKIRDVFKRFFIRGILLFFMSKLIFYEHIRGFYEHIRGFFVSIKVYFMEKSLVRGMNIYAYREVIFALIRIPLDQRAEFIAQAQSLITTDIDVNYFSLVITVLCHTPKEHRAEKIDRVLADRVEHPDEAQTIDRIIQILETPLEQPVPPRRGGMAAAAAMGVMEINVHAEGRDNDTKNAVKILLAHQKDLTKEQVASAYQAFRKFLGEYKNNHIKKEGTEELIDSQYFIDRATVALDNNDLRDKGFRGLIHTTENLLNIPSLSGSDLIGRLWHFAENYKEENERNLIKDSIVTTLADCFNEFEQVVCDEGKIQRLMTRVIQGRLDGVHIDTEIPVTAAPAAVVPAAAAAANDDMQKDREIYIGRKFFTPEVHKITTIDQMEEEITKFLAENTDVSEDELRKILEPTLEAFQEDSDDEQPLPAAAVAKKRRLG